MTCHRVPGSFRDPAGHVFTRQGEVFRSISHVGRGDFEHLMSSGLYASLVDARLLVPHENLGRSEGLSDDTYTVIRPQRIPLISYPHEWCFSQMKDAALATLDVQERALGHGMSLKDASAYNVQFLDGRWVLIDTLSLEREKPGPWVAYRQFCQHFLGPLLLVSHADPCLGRISSAFIDGLPLRAVSRMLPWTTWLKPGPLLHVHLHAASEGRLAQGAGRGTIAASPGGSDTGRHNASVAMVQSLRSGIRKLSWRPRSTWLGYYDSRESYAIEATAQKEAIVAAWLDQLLPSTVWDVGANTGRYSALASARGAFVVALDQDAACVERMYLDAAARGDRAILPLVMDLANPSPSYGWALEERSSIVERGPADLVLALAVVHHLAITNNVPFASMAAFLRRLGRRLIVEFVPKDDPMVQAMAGARRGMADYSQQEFEDGFAPYFSIAQRVPLDASARVLYLME